jgi:hypothetical protein
MRGSTTMTKEESAAANFINVWLNVSPSDTTPQRPKNEQKSDPYRGGTNLQYSKFVEDNMKWLTSYKRYSPKMLQITRNDSVGYILRCTTK